MAELGYPLKLIFLMRDPVGRTFSHVQHSWRRTPELKLEDVIANLGPGSPYYERSNYGHTIDAVLEVIPAGDFLPLFYEDLFNNRTVARICAFLGIRPMPADASVHYNISRGPRLDVATKATMRDKLAPIYDDMHRRFGADIPRKWMS